MHFGIHCWGYEKGGDLVRWSHGLWFYSRLVVLREHSHRVKEKKKERVKVADLFSSLPVVPQSIDKRSLPDIIGQRRSVDFDSAISGVFP